ncbi:MAG: hypothetical protein H0T96_08730 [Thermoleophilaceae bacterium]|jgi:hypothetical protein|nr:hypothetical protein [Thermoleophilaceae bacterium]MDQ3319516.1 hypothetical protein [Actinomycetota bacterium]MDQ3355265.1 hypothetical protein [Actinomycetota bacterium]
MTDPPNIKRFPWMSREDAEILRHLPRDQARAFEGLLQQQARSEHRFREVNETDLGGPDVVEAITAPHTIRTGRRVRRHKPAE